MAKTKNNNKIQIKFKKLHPNAVTPKYSHDGDVCMDMTAVSMEYDILNDMYIYHTGLAFESDKNIGQFLFLRSSNCKTDAYLCNGVGVADSSIYRGEIQFRMKNRVPTNLLVLEERKILREYSLSRLVNEERKHIKKNWFYKLFKRKSNSEWINEILDVILDDNYISEHDRERIAYENAPYKVGDRIGQMVFLSYPTVELVEVDELSETERGEGGFGSTGK